MNVSKPIKSCDPNAIEALAWKLTALQEKQAMMKAANAFYRKNGNLDGCALPSEIIAEGKSNLRVWGGVYSGPFPQYELSNNNASIKRTRDRLAKLERERACKPIEDREIEVAGEIATVVEDDEEMRLRLVFADKPCEECRELLKRNGFKWSPKNQAWQRLLNDNARCAVRRLAS